MPRPASKTRRPSQRRARAAPAANVRTVADKAGVSIATVSRVLNGKAPVKAETRERVLAVVKRMGYAPHPAARSLKARRTETLGVVLPDLYGEFYSELLRGIDRAARREGFHVLVSGSHSDRGEVEAVLAALRGRVDALVLMFPDIGPEALAPPLLDVPAVLLNCAVAGQPCHSLRIDNYGGAAAVVRYLAGLGHRRIAFVAGPPSNLDAAERRRGFLAEVRKAGGALAATILRGGFTEESGFRAGQQLLAAPHQGVKVSTPGSNLPTAIFAANDAMALGCLHALRQHGLDVPGDVSLVGFDDIPAARYVQPPLTTVRVPIAELGERAVARALEAVRLGTPRRQTEERLPVALVERSSCAAVAGDTAAGAHPAPQPTNAVTRRRRP
jgi:LacI family transcriptional regulator